MASEIEVPGPLGVVLDYVGVARARVEDSDMLSLATGLGLDAVATDEFLETVSEFADWDGPMAPDGEFEFRVGRWHLDLRREAIRGGLLGAILTVVLEQTDVPGAGFAMLAAVVPSLFDIEDVSLDAKDRRLLFLVRRDPAIVDRDVQVVDLYASLPGDVRSQVHELDFIEFVDRLREAGYARPTQTDILTNVLPAGRRPPLIQWV